MTGLTLGDDFPPLKRVALLTSVELKIITSKHSICVNSSQDKAIYFKCTFETTEADPTSFPGKPKTKNWNVNVKFSKAEKL